MVAWNFEEVETFDCKVNFLRLYLHPVHLVNASSSCNSKEGGNLSARLGTATPSVLAFGIIYSLTYFPALFRLVKKKKPARKG